jgi:hypothetical protein
MLLEFAVKWLPCGCQKLHPTVFWHLEIKPKVKKPKKNYLFLVAARTLTLWVGTMLCASWRNRKINFSSGRCAAVGFCCKMAPLRPPKVAYNRILAFGNQTKSEKTEKNYLFLVAARTLTLWVGTRLCASWRNQKINFSSGKCAAVGFCRKMAPLRLPKVASNRFLAFGYKTSPEKSEKYYLFPVAALALTLWVGTMLCASWRNEKNTFSSGRCAVVGICCKMPPLRPPKVASNRFLAFGDQTKSQKTEKNYLFLCCCPYSDSVGWDHAVCIMAEPKN